MLLNHLFIAVEKVKQFYILNKYIKNLSRDSPNFE